MKKVSRTGANDKGGHRSWSSEQTKLKALPYSIGHPKTRLLVTMLLIDNDQ